MPQEIQNGTAVVWGIAAATGQKLQVPGYAGVIMESLKIVHKHETAVIKDENDATTSMVATDGYKEADFMFVPSGTPDSNTRDQAYASAIFLPPHARVDLKGFRVNPGPSVPNASDWNNDPWHRVSDQSLDLAHKEGKLVLKLRQWDDKDQNALLCTQISGT